jgi:DNA-binding PadR family transcriptional regulator
MFGSEFWQGHGRRRFKRGMLKWVVLKILDEGERHGYDFMRLFRERGFGPGPGSIYPLLSQLEQEGLVTGRDEGDRRVYTITEEGRRHLREDAPGPGRHFFEQFFQEAWSREVAPHVTTDFDAAFKRLAAAWNQAQHAANPQTLEKIGEILNRARKEIYTVLADE